MSPEALIACGFLSILLLIWLIVRAKVSPFIALILASLAAGISTGMPVQEIVSAFQDGVGAILGSLALVIALGAVLGKVVQETGGAESLATALIRLTGPSRAPWTMLLLALCVGAATFFVVGLVLLFPVFTAVANRQKLPLLAVGIPVLAGLSVMHGFVPPHPGPMAAVNLLDANPGITVLYGIALGSVTAVAAGPLLASRLAAKVQLAAPSTPDQPAPLSKPNHAGAGATIACLLCPVTLMQATTAAKFLGDSHPEWASFLSFLGTPWLVMFLSVLLSYWLLGRPRGLSGDQLSALAETSLYPVGIVLLVIGTGAGFSKVLIASGISEALAAWAGSFRMPLPLLGWLLAALIRVATGSATVAITTAAGMIAPAAAEAPGVNAELLVIALGAGSLILSHVNDGGFWFVKEYFRMSVPETFQTWTVMETVIAIVGLILVLIADLIF